MEPPIDRGWAWVSLVGVWISCFFIVGGLKSTGILFVEFIKMYDAPSSLTALAMGLILLVMSITSPFACALGERFSYRVVVATGGILMTIAPIIAMLCRSVYLLVFLFGPVTGLGYGCVFTPSMVVVSQYFDQKRTLATGIAVSGSSIGQLVIPQIIRALIDAYTTRGALLIFAGLNLNVVVGAALFRPFSFYTRRRIAVVENEVKEVELQTIDKVNSEPSATEVKGDANGQAIESKDGNANVDIQSQNKFLEGGNIEPAETKPFIDKTPKTTSTEVSTKSDKANSGLICLKCCKSDSDRPPLFDCSLFKLWVFRTYLCGVVASYFGYINPILFVPAFARDQGASPFHQALLVSIMGISDFAGRLFSGWLGNLGIIKRSWILSCSQAVSGVILIICTIFHSYVSAIVICISHGAIAGALFSLFSVVLVDFIGKERISAGMGLTFLFMGSCQTPMPSLLGFFRDKTGTYNYAFYLCGAVGIISSVFYLLEPCARRLDERNAAKAESTTQEQPV